MKKRLNLIQMLRAIAIIFVMFGHLNKLIYDQFSYDWFGIGSWGRTGGVDLFLVISGFMITYLYTSYIGVKGEALPFIKKRLLRIVPFYWLVTIGAASLFFIFPQLGDGSDRSPLKIISSLFFLNTDPTLVVAWSLTHIILFYCMFSLLIACTKMMRYILGLWLGISILFLMDLTPFSNLNPTLFGINNLEIWMGALAAYLVKKVRVKVDFILLILGISSLVVLWINNTYSYFPIELGVIRPLLYGISSFLIIISLTSIDLRKNVKIPNTLTLAGNASYSIFLTHGPFLQFYILVFKKIGIFSLIGINISMIIILILTISTGILIYKAVEIPMSKLFTGWVIKRDIKSSQRPA
ncbi:acyltransferase [Priestia filamentosa]|uniref:acyltransferase family protein n=1 Tax=Priestia filamentosa TaxID=1402861 RepID=UPI003F187EE8